MAATGTELQDRVRLNLGGRTDKDTSIMQAINNAIVSIARGKHDWRNLQKTFTTTVIAENNTITLPEYSKNVLSLWRVVSETENVILQRISTYRHDRINNTSPNLSGGITTHIYQGDSRVIPSNDSGLPRSYHIHGNVIFIHPTPTEDTEFYIRVTAKPTVITADVEHDLGEQMDDVIVAIATSEMYLQLQLLDDAGAWLQWGERLKKQAIGAERRNPDWSPRLSADSRIRIP